MVSSYNSTEIDRMKIIFVFSESKLAGHVENFERPFDNTETDPGKLSIAFYSGIFSYAGW